MEIEETTALKQLIDGHSVSDVLHDIERICLDKAYHYHTHSRDKLAAKRWERAATQIGRLACKLRRHG